jgi:eukaryotic translation initiation factor 2C
MEEVGDMQNMFREMLRRFYQHVSKYPLRLIVFRDGVSEGQFDTIFHREIRAIKAACQEIGQEYAPPITFIVTQKRHRIRMFPERGGPTDRSGNVLPGTVIDDQIVHPRDFDFYLMSHAGIQGTSRPVHYYCLLDENGFSSDNLQAFVYRLCYTNARCTRSTSLPPPVFYAHLAAYRGRLLSEVDLWGTDTEVSAETAQRALLPLHESTAVNRSMFFL